MAKAKKKVAKKAKTAKVVEPKVWEIGLEARASTYDNGDGDDSSERYSYRGTTSTDWDVRGLRLLKSGEYMGYKRGDSTQVAFKPEVGKVYYALYAIYSTGDSFGHDHANCLELVGVYKSRYVADENKKRLTADGAESRRWDNATVELIVEGVDKPHKYYRPWTGYFESLDSLEVEGFVLT